MHQHWCKSSSVLSFSTHPTRNVGARNHHELAVMNMIGHRWITHRQQITHQILQLGQSLLVARSQPGLVAAIFGTLGKDGKGEVSPEYVRLSLNFPQEILVRPQASKDPTPGGSLGIFTP